MQIPSTKRLIRYLVIHLFIVSLFATIKEKAFEKIKIKLYLSDFIDSIILLIEHFLVVT